jgi:hypothetical protein
LPYSIAIRASLPRRCCRPIGDSPRVHVEAGFALFERLARQLREASIQLREPVLCLLPEPTEDDTMIRNVSRTGRVDAAMPREPASLHRFPASRVAFTTHVGAYEEAAQHAVAACARARACPAGAPERRFGRPDRS